MANIIPPSRQSFFDDKGNFTLQAFRFFEELTELANGTSMFNPVPVKSITPSRK